MIKKIFILLTILATINIFGQKPQKIGYIDMEYILENVPEYNEAQSKLDAKVTKWNAELEKTKKDIKTMQHALDNEKALLTTDLIADREEDIKIKQGDFRDLQNNYFGVDGDMYILRRQLVQPVQNQIFNAVQEIAKNKKYDMILDKSDELIMLYTNKKFDVSELVLNSIVKDRKTKDVIKKKSDRVIARETKKKEIETKISDRKTKQQELRAKLEKDRLVRIAKKDSIREARVVARNKKLEEIRQRQLGKNKENKPKEVIEKNTNKTDKDSKVIQKETTKVIQKETTKVVEKEATEEKPVVKTKEELREEKRKSLADRLAKQKAKRDSLKQVAIDKRAKKLAEIKARKEALKNKD
jgi:Skp family chaperone for outer membrane proteins